VTSVKFRRHDLVPARLFHRPALSREAKIRSMYDVSYVTDVVFAQLSSEDHAQHPLTVAIDPLTFGNLRVANE
jgi:hypothetical protein